MKRKNLTRRSRSNTRRRSARVKPRRAPRRQTRAERPLPRNAEQFFARSERVQRTLTQVAHVLSRVRDGASLSHAIREAGISRKTALRWAGSALRKLPNGRYGARPTDRLLRVVRLPTVDGMRDSALRDSKLTTLVAEYWNAVHKYLATGDASGLARFEGVTITDADGERFTLLTDRTALNRLGGAGVLSFESIYARTV